MEGASAPLRGLRPFLVAARVSMQEGALTVELPDGPALERVRDPAVLQSLRAELGRHVSAPVDLRVIAPEAAAPAEPERVSQEVVSRTRLQELLKREPALRRAVEELDLELLD